MTRLITMSEIQEHYRMADCLQALDEMFQELGKGAAITNSREDILTYLDDPPEDAAEPVYYNLKSMGGVIPSMGVGALRTNSYVLHWPTSGGQRVRDKFPAADGRLTGLVILFSTQTGKPLAIFPDRIIQSYRVGATSALGVKYLAREDASTLGLLGSGWQARAHLVAIDQVRDLERVRVYSPTSENRKAFVSEMDNAVDATLEAVDSAEIVFEDTNIIQSTTNALSPVFDLDWVESGTHISVIRDAEAPPALFEPEQFDAFVQSWSKSMQLEELGTQVTEREIPTKNVNSYVVEGDEPVPKFSDRETTSDPLCDWTKVAGLGEIVTDETDGRSSPEGITVFYNRGMGVQFAAAGKVLYDIAKREELGRTIPTELLTEEPRPDIPL